MPLVVEAVRKVTEGSYELRLATSSLSETMLSIVKKVEFVEVVHDRAVDYVLKDFARDRDEGDRAVIFNFTFVTFFEDWNNSGFLPVVWDGTLSEGGLIEEGE